MIYLCPNHVKTIACDPVMAMTLWHGAMDNGFSARDKGDWTAARSFFGAAFETAGLHVQSKSLQPKSVHAKNVQSKTRRPNNEFTLQHLLDASSNLSGVLQELKLWEEAQRCLLTVQNRLLLECNNKTRLSQTSPEQMLYKTQQLVDEMIALFAFVDDETGIKPQSDHNAAAINKESPSLEILVASTFFIMSRYTLAPTDKLRAAIVDHLRRLFNCCEEKENPILKNTCRRLYLQWQKTARLSSDQRHNVVEDEVLLGQVAKRVH